MTETMGGKIGPIDFFANTHVGKHSFTNYELKIHRLELVFAVNMVSVSLDML